MLFRSVFFDECHVVVRKETYLHQFIQHLLRNQKLGACNVVFVSATPLSTDPVRSLPQLINALFPPSHRRAFRRLLEDVKSADSDQAMLDKLGRAFRPYLAKFDSDSMFAGHRIVDLPEIHHTHTACSMPPAVSRSCGVSKSKQEVYMLMAYRGAATALSTLRDKSLPYQEAEAGKIVTSPTSDYHQGALLSVVPGLAAFPGGFEPIPHGSRIKKAKIRALGSKEKPFSWTNSTHLAQSCRNPDAVDGRKTHPMYTHVDDLCRPECEGSRFYCLARDLEAVLRGPASATKNCLVLSPAKPFVALLTAMFIDLHFSGRFTVLYIASSQAPALREELLAKAIQSSSPSLPLVVVSTIVLMGEGLDKLKACSSLFIMSAPLGPTQYKQAVGRIFRRGQLSGLLKVTLYYSDHTRVGEGPDFDACLYGLFKSRFRDAGIFLDSTGSVGVDSDSDNG